MDKNQIIGLVLIFLILIGWSYFSRPSEEEMKTMEMKRDSARIAQKEQALKDSLAQVNNETANISETQVDTTVSDSVVNEELNKKYGRFAKYSSGSDELVTLENQYIKIKFTKKGAYPVYAEVKNFKTFDDKPLILFKGNDNAFAMSFYADNMALSTDELYFENVKGQANYNAENSETELKFRLAAGPGKYLEYSYRLSPESYMVDFDIEFVGMQEIIPKNTTYISLDWDSKLRRHEQGSDWENQNSTVYYKFFEDEVDYLSETSDDKEKSIDTKVRWLSYKGQFFSTALITHKPFASAEVSYTKDEAQEVYLKNVSSNISIDYTDIANEPFKMAYYFGPNDYDILKNIKVHEGDELKMSRMLPLGWSVFRWINQFIVIKLFNFLGSYIANYGVIIIIMTVIIKLVLFPLTFKSYSSSAKMRVLKPQINEINKKIPKEKSMERQKATMSLYKKAGVNPMGGCLPMLIQFPFLIAMFRFFPASIELRQKSFLWATDLSTYDTIWDFPGGFEIPFYGDHVSLFTLLMAVALLFSTMLNQNQMSGGSNAMPGMKTMLYLMPLMMLFWFNNYSSGLSFYYFLSNTITIGQTLIIRRMINEEDILKKLNQNKKKKKKKSKFQKRLDEMAKKQEELKRKKK
ncbi:MAG: membrane protein insertase YidC [Bacteroidota bacterium]|nr:membrane protein insertase YidC [Bacteroidota bacterium]